MQSYANFTVGGSVSVNCHGRYVGKGGIIGSIQTLQLVMADGSVREVSRSQDRELFQAVVGGYGGIAVITEVELSLDENLRIQRRIEDIPLAQYAGFFERRVKSDSAVLLHNADLSPPFFDRLRAVSWVKTELPVNQPLRLVPRGQSYAFEQNAIFAVSELAGGQKLREKIAEREMRKPAPIVWRNFEASQDAASLEPRTRVMSSYLLQEYFIPKKHFLAFVGAMAKILVDRRVNALNVSIRHAPPDGESLLSWAPEEVFSFVLYYKQRTSMKASLEVGVWARELIAQALRFGGTYYLPYRLDATPAQFKSAYPRFAEYQRVKAAADPSARFQNLLLQKYFE
jgi:FAD/FMN-containing dehydrogenase